MHQMRLRKFSNYEYGDPAGFLVQLRKVEVALPDALPGKVRRLRTNSLKTEREMRDAALFCVGMSAIISAHVRFAPVEDEDFDFVATWWTDNTQFFCPVQLKEIVPEDLVSTLTIDDLLKKLSKYSDIRNLTVAIRLNRTSHFDPASLLMPKEISLGGLWVFGSTSADQSKWAIWGDFAGERSDVSGTAYDYPS